MFDVDLPDQADDVHVYHLLDWHPAPDIAPNPELLQRAIGGRSRQSATSRKRQAFISGVNSHRMMGDERAARRQYLDDWHAGILYND